MKKLLALLLVAVFASSVIAAETAKKEVPAKKEAPAKKEVKKHKKFDGEKVPEPAKKK